MSNTGALTAPKEGLDARVGSEMGDTMGWLLRRTKRVEELLAQPHVMEMADALVTHIDRYCAAEEFPVKDLEVNILPTRTKRYITIQLATDACHFCEGQGIVQMKRCDHCEGTGLR